MILYSPCEGNIKVFPIFRTGTFIPIFVVPRFAAGSFERLQLFDKMVKLARWAGKHLDALP